MQDFPRFSYYFMYLYFFLGFYRRVFPHKFFFYFISFAARKVAKFHSKSIYLVMTRRRIPSSVLTSSPRSPHSRNSGTYRWTRRTIISSPVVLGLGEGSTRHPPPLGVSGDHCSCLRLQKILQYIILKLFSLTIDLCCVTLRILCF